MHFVAAFAAALAVAGGPAAPAAASHRLIGLVTDSAGAALAGVRVSVLELARNTTTADDGRFVLTDLPDGRYRLSLAAIGFQPIVRPVQIAGADDSVTIVLRKSLIELPALQVTASPIATSLLSSPQPSAVLGGTDLREDQAASLGETLRGVAGVHSLSTGAGIGKPVIRGLTSNRVLVLDNGQRLETQQWGDEHGPNVETATAERIEVIKGPASVLYGSDALGGVVNIIPRALPWSDGAPVTRGTISAAYGTNNRQPDGSFLVEGGGRTLAARLALSGRTGGDLRTPDYLLWNSNNRAAGGTGTFGVRGGWGEMTATFSQRNERIGLTDEDPAETPTQRIETSRGRLGLNAPVGRWRMEADVGYERNRRREFASAATDEVGLGLLSGSWTGNLHLHHAPLGPLNGTLGLSGERIRFDKFGEETLIPGSATVGLGVFAFEQAESGRWNLSFGARFDYRRLDVDDDDDLGVTAQTRRFNSVTGNIGLLYHVSEPVALALNVGRGFRAPSSFDLFSNGVHEGTVAFERGNADLNVETSFNTDVAVRILTGSALVELGGFVNRIGDFIYTVPTGETDPASGFEIYDVTQGDATLVGFEVSGQWHPSSWLHVDATADYTRGQNTAAGQPLPLIPPLRLTYGVRFEGRSRGALAEPYFKLGGESNARQNRQDPAEIAFYRSAFDGTGYRSAGYTLLNAGTGAGIRTGGATIQVDLAVRNLLNVAYADYLSRIKTTAPNPGMGRNVTIRLSTDF